MQTPIEKLIDKIKEYERDEQQSYDYKLALKIAISLAASYGEMERGEIIEAYNSGVLDKYAQRHTIGSNYYKKRFDKE